MDQAAAPPASIPLGTVATVARCGHQVQISGIREGFSSGNLCGSEARTLRALIQGGPAGK